jgi:hypothetical protein
MRFLLFSFCFLLSASFVKGQSTGGGNAEEQKHLLYFLDKTNSPYSVEKPAEYLSSKALERRSRQNIPLTPRDFPVNPNYVTGLKQQGVKLLYTSRWFNAAVVQCTQEKLAELQTLPYVRTSQTLNRIANSPVRKSGVNMDPPSIRPIC